MTWIHPNVCRRSTDDLFGYRTIRYLGKHQKLAVTTNTPSPLWGMNGGLIRLWGLLLSRRSWKAHKGRGKRTVNARKYYRIWLIVWLRIEENYDLLADLISCKLTSQCIQQKLHKQGNEANVLEWPCQSPIENLGLDLKRDCVNYLATWNC